MSVCPTSLDFFGADHRLSRRHGFRQTLRDRQSIFFFASYSLANGKGPYWYRVEMPFAHGQRQLDCLDVRKVYNDPSCTNNIQTEQPTYSHRE